MDVLAFQEGLGAGAEDGVENIEMAVLYHEHLTSDASDNDTTRSTILFARAVLSKIKVYLCVPDQPLDQVIECPRLVRAHKPELRDPRLAYVIYLCFRYDMTFTNDDYEEAGSTLTGRP